MPTSNVFRIPSETGTLRVKIIETTDVHVDEDFKNALLAIRLYIQSAGRRGFRAYSTGAASRDAEGRLPALHGETFYLSDVEEDTELLLDLVALRNYTTGQGFSPQSLGHLTVPVNRLYNQVMISQWYPFSCVDGSDFLRTAVKLEIQYVSDPIPFRIDLAARLPDFETERGTERADAGGGSADVTGRDTPGTLQEEGPLTSYIKALRSGEAKLLPAVPPTPSATATSTSPSGHQLAPLSPLSDTLPTGLAEYVLLVGPVTETFDFSAEGGDFEGALRTRTDVSVWDRFPVTDYPGSSIPSKVEWFCFPNGSETKWAIERPAPVLNSFAMFATENGQYGVCIVFYVKSGKTRPVQQQQDLTGGGEAGVGTAEDAVEQQQKAWWDFTNDVSPLTASSPDVPPPAQDGAAARPQDASSSSSLSSSNTGRSSVGSKSALLLEAANANFSYNWVAVSLCFLTRGPFVEELSEKLLRMYRADILPELERWENTSDDFSQKHLPSLQLMKCACPIVAICIEAPLPVPGLFKVDLSLPHRYYEDEVDVFVTKHWPAVFSSCVSDEDFSSLRVSRRLVRPAGSPPRLREVTVPVFSRGFVLTPPDRLPRCQYSITNFVATFGVRGTIDLFRCALLEQKIVFYSSQASTLPMHCESLKALLYPFTYCWAFVPVVPYALLDLIEAPLPYILGVQSEWLEDINPDLLYDVVLADCDTGFVEIGPNTFNRRQNAPFPPQLERWLVTVVRFVLGCMDNLCGKSDVTMPHMERTYSNRLLNMDTDRALQLLFLDALSSLLEGISSCVMVVDGESPFMNKTLFSTHFVAPENKAFVNALMSTQAFDRFISGLNSRATQFFRRSMAKKTYYYCRKVADGVNVYPSWVYYLCDGTCVPSTALDGEFECVKFFIMNRLESFASIIFSDDDPIKKVNSLLVKIVDGSTAQSAYSSPLPASRSMESSGSDHKLDKSIRRGSTFLNDYWSNAASPVPEETEVFTSAATRASKRFDPKRKAASVGLSMSASPSASDSRDLDLNGMNLSLTGKSEACSLHSFSDTQEIRYNSDADNRVESSESLSFQLASPDVRMREAFDFSSVLSGLLEQKLLFFSEQSFEAALSAMSRVWCVQDILDELNIPTPVVYSALDGNIPSAYSLSKAVHAAPKGVQEVLSLSLRRVLSGAISNASDIEAIKLLHRVSTLFKQLDYRNVFINVLRSMRRWRFDDSKTNDNAVELNSESFEVLEHMCLMFIDECFADADFRSALEMVLLLSNVSMKSEKMIHDNKINETAAESDSRDEGKLKSTNPFADSSDDDGDGDDDDDPALEEFHRLRKQALDLVAAQEQKSKVPLHGGLVYLTERSDKTQSDAFKRFDESETLSHRLLRHSMFSTRAVWISTLHEALVYSNFTSIYGASNDVKTGGSISVPWRQDIKNAIEELRNLGCDYKDVIICLQAAAFYGALDFGEYVSYLTWASIIYGYDVTFNDLKSLFDDYVSKLRRFVKTSDEKEAKKPADSKLTTKLMNFVLGNRSSRSAAEDTTEDKDNIEDNNVESVINLLGVSMIKYSESTRQLTAENKPPLYLTRDNSSSRMDLVQCAPPELLPWRASEARSREVLCVSATEDWVVSGDIEGNIVMYGSKSRRVECTRSHSKAIISVVCLPGDSGVLSCCEKGTINIWNYPKHDTGDMKTQAAGKASPAGDDIAHKADSAAEGAVHIHIQPPSPRGDNPASLLPASGVAAAVEEKDEVHPRADGEGGLSKVEKAALYDEINSPAAASSRWSILKRIIRKKSASIKLSSMKVSSFASNASSYKSDHVPLMCAVGGTCGELRVVSKWGNEFFETFNLNAVYAALSTANAVSSVSLFVPPDSIFNDCTSTSLGDVEVGGALEADSNDPAPPPATLSSSTSSGPPRDESSPRASVFSLKRKPKPITQTRAHCKGEAWGVLGVGLRSGVVQAWDIASRKKLFESDDESAPGHSGQVSASEVLVLRCQADPIVIISSIGSTSGSGNLSSSLGARPPSQVCLLVSGGLDTKMNIYDISQQSRVACLSEACAPITAIKVVLAEDRLKGKLFAASADGVIRAYSIEALWCAAAQSKGGTVPSPSHGSSSPGSIGSTGVGADVAVGVRVCVHLEAVLLGHVDRITDLQVSSDRSLLVSSSHDGTVRLWPGPGGRSTAPAPSASSVPSSVAPVLHTSSPRAEGGAAECPRLPVRVTALSVLRTAKLSYVALGSVYLATGPCNIGKSNNTIKSGSNLGIEGAGGLGGMGGGAVVLVAGAAEGGVSVWSSRPSPTPSSPP